MSRILILTEGQSDPVDAKTATGVLRYRHEEVVGVLDSTRAGSTCQEVLGVGGDLPVVASVHDVPADTLLIGIAPSGGRLPEAWRRVLRDALSSGLDVVNGLHVFLGDDPELAGLARRHGAEIWDVRRPPKGVTVATDSARTLPCFRVHTVGQDCSVGKMVVSLELTRALRQHGRRASFVATGQTGIMISGRGVPIDAVVSDFISGAIEAQVLGVREEEFAVIEGQGSIVHPLYSGVTLGLLHGCAPQALVFCIDPTRETIRHCDRPLPPVPELIDVYERLANFQCPSKVIALALNTSRLDGPRAREETRRLQEATGLPATDVVRDGSGALVRIVTEAEARHRQGRWPA